MRNFKLTIEYDGTDFCGWQAQGNGERTVQAELEKVCAVIFKQAAKVIASGRTDSGVHAVGQVVSIKVDTRMKGLEIQKAFNGLLPADVVILHVKEVSTDFHAQYSVKEKTYRYSILNRPTRSAFFRERTYFYPFPLNLSAMTKAAKHLLGRHDFKSFQAYDPLRADRDSVRTIKRISIRKTADLLLIDVTANGFLYKMARNIAGTLIAVGGGLLPAANIPKILKAKNRKAARNTAPAHGLSLMDVRY